MQRYPIAAILMASVCAATVATAASAQTAFIDQQGTRNDATIDQAGASGASMAEIVQSGSENRTAVDQDGSNQTAFIEIDGDENNSNGRLEVQTGREGRASLPAGSIIQGGRNNEVEVAVNGDNNAFAIDQSGRGNEAFIQQGAGVIFGESAPVREVAVLETFSGNGNGNNAIQIQRGTGNSATTVQTGNNNTARSYQSGQNNTLVQGQAGSNNLSSVAQLNGNNALVHFQIGNGLSSAAEASGESIQIRQFGGAPGGDPLIVVQTSN